jgi:penicillin-binding protein 1C
MKRPRMSKAFKVRATVAAGGCLCLGVAAFAVAWVAYPLPPSMLAIGPAGTLALDRSGSVMLDVTASDEQRRLPVSLDDVGEWIPAAVLAAEDRSFYSHFGVDLSAVVGAVRDNILAGRVVRGASTITMQVAGLKLSHPRSFKGKAVEAFRSLQLEAAFTKEEILEAWLNLAPFGGNIVGVETASWAYFGKPARACSLAEAAFLIALPNSPERLRPDRNPTAAVHRKNLILRRMTEEGFISKEAFETARHEVVLIQPSRAIANDKHVGWMVHAPTRETPVVSLTIEPDVQVLVEALIKHHAAQLPEGLDIAVVVVNLETAAVEALVGSSDFMDPRDGQVNGTTASRSPGSALKPFVYAAAFEAHRLAPESLVDDEPLDLGGWKPANIDRTFRGAMPAAEALRLSRNTPALRIARDLGLGHIAATLRACGIPCSQAALNRSGLSAVVGSLETSPWSLAEAYATLGRGGVHQPLRLNIDDPIVSTRVLSEASCAAVELSLAGTPSDAAEAMPFLAAKTGTSSGHRDAVAAGWNRTHAAVVWVGRFDGGSDAALLGAEAAAPILRELLLNPRLATKRSPRNVESWNVVRQVGRAAPRSLQILEPRNGDAFVALERIVRVTPKLRTTSDRAVLFVNGMPLRTNSVELPIGTHEFRLVEHGKSPHAITFSVVSPRAPQSPTR